MQDQIKADIKRDKADALTRKEQVPAIAEADWAKRRVRRPVEEKRKRKGDILLFWLIRESRA